MEKSLTLKSSIKGNGFFANQNLKKEEITTDYSKSKIQEAFTCNYGTNNCKRQIKIR
jgi:hypothetical protein